jgi:Phosphoribosylaminoimidazolesuccinocarboxamide (SAICAR) synthase
MTEDKLLYTGKAKNVYQAKQDDEVLIVYKDQATALNGKKKKFCQEKEHWIAKFHSWFSTI